MIKILLLNENKEGGTFWEPCIHPLVWAQALQKCYVIAMDWIVSTYPNWYLEALTISTGE